MQSNRRLQGMKLATRAVLAVLVAMLLVHVWNLVSQGALLGYGIQPRDPDRWYHLVTAPFIHGSNAHLANNLLGLAVFGSLVALRSPLLFAWGSLFIILFSGALVWLVGREASHIGASGWIFGLWSLCIALGFLDRRPASILLAVAVIVFYGGMAYGVLPGEPGISFESHMAGAAAGVVTAYGYVRLRRRRNQPD